MITICLKFTHWKLPRRHSRLVTHKECAVWFGELLNRILCCTYVYFEGERFIRADANVPEMSQPIEGYKSYIFKQILQDIKIVDYTESENLIKIRRVDDKSFRKVANKILTV